MKLWLNRKQYTLHGALCLCALVSVLMGSGCQQQEITADDAVHYGDSIYALKAYKVDRHPTVLRNGFGMDIYHVDSLAPDTTYLKSDTASFQWDLKFYNEQAYTKLSTGDYSPTGYPVIFMYTDTLDAGKSVRAVMIGQGIARFNAFSADSVARYVAQLRFDPFVRLSNYRLEVHTNTVNGKILMQPAVDSLYNTLTIGMKFRPNTGAVFSLADASDEAQINLQPVFLVRTREGLYAKFMVTRFKGVGTDAQKTSMQWQALRTK